MDAVTTGGEIVGLKEALKTLNKIDKSLRREITKDYKQIVQGVIDEAQTLVPNGVPLSGMARSWTTKSGLKMLPWVAGAKQKIVAKINTRNIREYGGRTTNVGVFSIVYQGSTGTLFDMASNGRLGRALTARYGDRSRVMWKAWQSNETEVMSNMNDLVQRVMSETSRELM